MLQDNTELVQFHSFKEDHYNSVLLTGYKQNTNFLVKFSIKLTFSFANWFNVNLKYKSLSYLLSCNT
jgi:hypothetical protein